MHRQEYHFLNCRCIVVYSKFRLPGQAILYKKVADRQAGKVSVQ